MCGVVSMNGVVNTHRVEEVGTGEQREGKGEMRSKKSERSNVVVGTEGQRAPVTCHPP